MDVDTCYSELGLTPESTDAEIKAAWRRLAARWHPDRNDSPQALRKIQRINRALEEIRKARSSAGSSSPAASGQDPPAAAEPTAGSDEETGNEPGRTLNHTVRLTLEEAAAGCVRELQGTVVDDCAACAATGVQATHQGCPTCGGAGQVRQPLWFGWVAAAVGCRACQGSGVARHPCAACEGRGTQAPRRYRCRIEIPAGVRHNDLLQVRARTPGAGRRHDTVQVRVELQPHAFFQLDDDGTVRCELPVDGFAWVANRWIDVPTPAGLQQMRLRRGHLTYRIRNQGFPSARSGPRGDCLVTVVPLFPDEFSSKQEAQIDRLIATNSGAADTAAGCRTAAWNAELAAWQARLTNADPPPRD